MGSAVRGTKRLAPAGAVVPKSKQSKPSKPASSKGSAKAKARAPSPSASESSSSESESDGSSAIDMSSEDELDDLDEPAPVKATKAAASSDSEESSVGEGKGEAAADADSDADSDDSDAASGDAVSDASGAAPTGKSSAEAHAEQKKTLAERKLQRKSGTEVQQIKALWERLRVNKPTPPKQVRDKLCDEIWALLQDCILDLVMKHDALRVVQTLVKYSARPRRDAVVQALRGNYYQLATSLYGKYLLVKLLHYGSKESRAVIVDELHGKLRKLMRHREGAYVVEDLYVLYLTAEQRQQMVREFWGAEYAVFRDSGKGKTILEICAESAEKKHLIMTNLIGTITASVEKGLTGFQILHAAMRDYVTVLIADVEAEAAERAESEERKAAKGEDEKEKQSEEASPKGAAAALHSLIELLTEQFAELVHTPEGCDVACQLVAVATAKEKKLLVRALRLHAAELSKNDSGNVVLTALYMTVDDTVMLHKLFSAELFTNEALPTLASEKFSRRPLLYLLRGLDARYFAPAAVAQLRRYERLAYTAGALKKPQPQRRSELVDRALPLIYTALLELLDPDLVSLVLVNIAAQFITELVLTPTPVAEVNAELRPQLVARVFDVAVRGDVREDLHLVNKVPFVTRLLKALIQGPEFKWDQQSKKLVRDAEATKIDGVGATFAARILDELLATDALAAWVANGQALFVVVAMYEVLQLLQNSRFKDLQRALKPLKKSLGADADNKGALLLASLLS